MNPQSLGRPPGRRSAVLLGMIAALALSGPQLAQAACAKNQLGGKYELYIFASTVKGSATWTRCVMTVKASGALKTGTACSNDRGGKGEITGGKLKLRKNCAVSGTIEIDSADADLDHGIMNLENNAFSALGHTNNELILQITATRR